MSKLVKQTQYKRYSKLAPRFTSNKFNGPPRETCCAQNLKATIHLCDCFVKGLIVYQPNIINA